MSSPDTPLSVDASHDFSWLLAPILTIAFSSLLSVYHYTLSRRNKYKQSVPTSPRTSEYLSSAADTIPRDRIFRGGIGVSDEYELNRIRVESDTLKPINFVNFTKSDNEKRDSNTYSSNMSNTQYRGQFTGPSASNYAVQPENNAQTGSIYKVSNNEGPSTSSQLHVPNWEISRRIPPPIVNPPSQLPLKSPQFQPSTLQIPEFQMHPISSSEITSPPLPFVSITERSDVNPLLQSNIILSKFQHKPQASVATNASSFQEANLYDKYQEITPTSPTSTDTVSLSAKPTIKQQRKMSRRETFGDSEGNGSRRRPTNTSRATSSAPDQMSLHSGFSVIPGSSIDIYSNISPQSRAPTPSSESSSSIKPQPAISTDSSKNNQFRSTISTVNSALTLEDLLSMGKITREDYLNLTNKLIKQQTLERRVSALKERINDPTISEEMKKKYLEKLDEIELESVDGSSLLLDESENT
ncbi:hypothetical protein HK098_003664 [Nowakowskiella sp. JEL0407]|nr:hypothetical protein HK098_003664 [Nowakowskiella sp. JEL0407]